MGFQRLAIFTSGVVVMSTVTAFEISGMELATGASSPSDEISSTLKRTLKDFSSPEPVLKLVVTQTGRDITDF